MSEENQVALIPHADFTIKDLEAIQQFKDNGLLGLHTLKDTDCERAMGLYVDGKTYRQIANVLKINKTVILFLAHKFSWFEMRKEYLEELRATLKDKVIESKLQSQQFLLDLTLAYQKKIGKNIDQYLRTDNEDFADKIDSKDLSSLLKVIELLHRLNSENLGNPNNDKSLVGLNGLGEGVTITKTGTNSVEITPKVSQYSSKLKQMAELKRQQERDSQEAKKTHDILVETSNQESENENES